MRFVSVGRDSYDGRTVGKVYVGPVYLILWPA